MKPHYGLTKVDMDNARWLFQRMGYSWSDCMSLLQEIYNRNNTIIKCK